MKAERWDRLKDLVLRASELDDAARAAYLESECGDDAALRAEIESLLRWMPSASPDTQGYRVDATGPGGSEILLADAGNFDRCTVTGVVSPGTRSLRVTAYDRVPYDRRARPCR